MESIDTGDRSFRAPRVESVAQASVTLVESGVRLSSDLAALSREAAAASVVLLKNEGVLPLRPDSSVAVFGRCQFDFFCVGYGSGGDVKAPYAWNLIDALRDVDVRVDEELAAFYETWTTQNPPVHGGWAQWPFSYPEAPVDPGMVVSAAERADTAVVVIGRAAGEARDNKLEPGSYYLTSAETELLDAVCGAFERVVVVVDTGSAIDFEWVDVYGDRIASLVLAWHGGMEGARALAGVLSGEASPSGRLTSTIAKEYVDYPSAGSFGNEFHNDYTEDVFVGYRYFETFAPERVRYPFGYGLGYTAFSTDVRSVVVEGDEVRITVAVTNVGSEFSGCDVVQAYVDAPHGLLARPTRQLVAFGKTRLLAPGEVDVLELRASIVDFASYDETGVTGFRSAWVLEAGAYEMLLGADVRSATPVHRIVEPHTRLVEQLSQVLAPQADTAFSRMIVHLGEDGSRQVGWEEVPCSSTSRPERISRRRVVLAECDPVAGEVAIEDVARGLASIEAFVSSFTAEELIPLTRGDVVMNSALGAAGNAGVLGGVSETLRARGVRAVTATDGPSGIRLAGHASLLPSGTALASTWNLALVRELNALLADEMIALGSDVLLSPGMNIQRDPLCGRNFEYFSEDPVVTGLMGAAVVEGIQSRGVSACPKHFAANNQEANRTHNDSRVSERALREIYLRGFRICFQAAQPWAIMTAYNMINGVYAYYNDDLVTTVLRDEWGYDGVVMTDWWTVALDDPDFPQLGAAAFRLRAQVDVLMPGGLTSAEGPVAQTDDSDLLRSIRAGDGLDLAELQRSAVNVVRFVLRVSAGPGAVNVL